VRVDYRITNTGETVICCTGLGAGDANGKAASLTYNDVPDILPHQVPGEPVIISVNYVVTPEDISAGYLIRIAHSVFSDFVSYDDGHVLTPEEFGHVASVTGDKSWLTDNVRIEIPLKTLSSSAVIEVISAPASVPAETGAQVRVDYRVTNTGDTVICVPGFGAVDGNNSFAPVTFNDVPDFFPAQIPGEPATISVHYTVTQEDINAGFLIRSAHAPFSCFVSYDDGHVLTPEEYKTVTSKTGDKVYLTDDTLLSIPVGGPVPVSALHLEITSFSADPASPAGTVIAGTLKLTNTGDYALNILAGSIETAGGELLKTDYFSWFPEEAKCLTSGNSCEIGFCVEITDDDMKAGKVLRRFTMIALPVTLEEAPEYVRSNTETGIIELSVTKALHIELTSFSADEIHVPETVITGTLEVTNLSDIPLKIIAGSIENDLGEKLGTDYFHWFPPEADCLAPGESCTIIFYVSPVKHDADRQEILRDFTMIALPAGDDMSTDYVISNTVRGIIKITGPLPVFSGLKITKAEISKPEKDGYYREGEEVSYLITVTNTGDTAITGLTVYDSLKQENLGIIGEADVLNPSGSLQFTYTYRVSDFDVERGYVDNCARAEYTDDDFRLEVSNTVRVDTDGIPDDPVAPVIAPVKPNRPVPEDPGDPDDKTGKGCFADYTGDVPALSFCSGHQETENAAKAVSGSPADVRAIWKQALDEEYAEYLSRSNGPAMIIVLAERARFSAFLTAREQTLKQLYPDDPAKVDSIIAEMMREKVVVMCHELHTAPAPRGGFSLRVNGTSLSAFLAGMDRVYDTSAGICPADAAFFSAWLDARREMLDILWPGDPVEAQMALEQDVLNNTRMLNDMMQ
ncbi:MAG: hypothetical protein CW338_10505, partial [Clostridiales bacterium]|nr:hypothetical protein [Clostridiales bacterium]